ncbi:MAG: hypothetical protein QOH97_1693 [Actinoplanes sp.]|jgi:hypothetical protein|nr:hypothetical protein [Actinoplanes sp.]
MIDYTGRHPLVRAHGGAGGGREDLTKAARS